MSKKNLQKFTDFDTMFRELLNKEKVKQSDIEVFKMNFAERLNTELANRLNTVKGEDFDELVFKLDEVMPTSVKNQIWERNHNTITATISNLMQEYGRMPTASEIAIKAELSRQTVTKHLKEYAGEPQYNEIVEQFKFMTSKVLAKVFKFAVNGDMTAAKLYFNVVGAMNQNNQNTFIQNNNNYIQINGMVFNDEKLKTLKPEQLKTIESILISDNFQDLKNI